MITLLLSLCILALVLAILLGGGLFIAIFGVDIVVLLLFIAIMKNSKKKKSQKKEKK